MSEISIYNSSGALLKNMYQWDTNQTIYFTGMRTDSAPVIHFWDGKRSKALVVSPTVSVSNNRIYVDVPNILLQRPETIIIYAYYETDGDSDGTYDGGRTEYAMRIPVIPKPKPEDYEYIENIDYRSVAVLDSRMNNLIVHMAEGVTGDATVEVMDMRTGYDGTVYTTAGAAMRAMGTELSDRIDTLDENLEDTNTRLGTAVEIAVANSSNAVATANNALQSVSNLDAEVAEFSNELDRQKNRIALLESQSESYVDNGYVENGVAYFEHNGQILFQITGIGGGGGGGGGGDINKAVLTVTNNTGWLSTTIAQDGDCEVMLNWSSIEDEMPTGNGSLKITCNNVFKTSYEIAQGNVTANLKDYLSTGSNVVKVQISDVYGNARTISFNVTVVALYLTSSFDVSSPFTSAIAFPYTPVGAVAKTVHFILDGTEIGTQQTSVSNRQMTYSIAQQSHGAHTLRVYFESEINGETVRSNELYFEFIALEPLNNTVIITSSYHTQKVTQYESVIFPYMVYNPASLTSAVELYVNNEKIADLTVDRTEQSYTYRASEYGTLAFKIKSGTTEKVITVTVEELDINVEAETRDLKLYLTSQGRSNQEANPETWTYEEIETTFTGFNLTSDGWQTDDDGIVALRLSGGARIDIPYKPFATDFRQTGKTIEIEFATRDVLNYDATLFSCMSGGRGFELTAQRALLKSEQSEISMQYKEDEHVRVSFVVEKRSEHRLLLIYINGIASGVIQYPTNDDFSQVEPVSITAGSSDCTLDIYNIRIYDNDLTRHQILDNWIADTQVGADMIDRYSHNNVYNEYGDIVIEKLPNDLPYMIITAPELPQSKGDKKTCEVAYVDPVYPSRSYTAVNCQIDVQGTSSQYYARKNYKMKYKGGFTMNNGSHADKYALNPQNVPTSTFTMKADVASSEGANNVELARLYNSVCPYKTPAQLQNAKVRQGIDGFPIVIFWNNGTETSFLGKYNYNLDKGTPENFGFVNGDESWEILNNTSDRVIWKSADYSGTAWLNDFEARYPDTDPAYTNPAQLKEFAEWIATTDRDKATNETLPEPVTYGTGDDAVTYTTDSAEYRLAKFKDELGKYVEVDSALFYYLFTELFLMVDSRAKNAFPSFMGSEVVQ